jgi:subfamily B ATP-binding cassette protein MsbA
MADQASHLPQQSGWQIYRRLLSYSFSKWQYLALGSLALMVLSGMEALMVYLLGPFIDGSFVDKNYNDIKWIPVAMVVIFLVRGIANFIGTYLIGFVGAHVTKTLRQEMFERVQFLPTYYFDQQSSGTLLSKFSYDVEQITGAAVKSLRSLVEDTFKVVFLLGVMFINNWKLTLLFLIVIPVIAAIVAYTSKLFRKFSTKMQKSVGKITNIVEESVIGHRIVKIFGGQQYEIDKFEHANERFRRNSMRKITTKAASTPVIHTLVGFVLVAVLAIAARPGIAAEETAGGFVSFIIAMIAILTPARKLTLLNEILQTGIAAGLSVFGLIDSDKEKDPASKALANCKGKVEFNNVCFKYATRDEKAVEQINLQIKSGETIAFVGRSGSGKTTVVNLLPRFYDIDSGSISIDGVNITEVSLSSLRNQVAIVNQDVTLFNDTIANNIAYAQGIDSQDARVIEAAEAARVTEFTDKLPDKLNTLVGENGVLLSGGQRQRIAIARALLKDAPILILDEATSALDTESEQYIQKALELLQKDRTTLVIAHRLSTIEKADRIVVMDAGAIVEIGSHRELLDKGGTYASLYELQKSEPNNGSDSGHDSETGNQSGNQTGLVLNV